MPEISAVAKKLLGCDTLINFEYLAKLEVILKNIIS